MNTGLLREDERSILAEYAKTGLTEIHAVVMVLCDRLIEEREKNAELSKWLHYIALAVCESPELEKGSTPPFGKVTEIIIDRMQKAEADNRILIRASSLPAKQLADVHIRNERRPSKRITELEAELAEARKDSARLDWLFKVGDAAQHSRAAIDAAMKETK